MFFRKILQKMVEILRIELSPESFKGSRAKNHYTKSQLTIKKWHRKQDSNLYTLPIKAIMETLTAFCLTN